MAIKTGIYRHYKGGLYRVLGVYTHEQTELDHVVYEAVYKKEGQTKWVRPLSIFSGTVNIDGVTKPRFNFIREEVRKYHLKLIRDKGPELLVEKNIAFESKILNEIDFESEVLNKIVEEATELKRASIEKKLDELADLTEAISAYLNFKNISFNKLKEIRNEININRGSFNDKIFLIWSEKK